MFGGGWTKKSGFSAFRAKKKSKMMEKMHFVFNSRKKCQDPPNMWYWCQKLHLYLISKFLEKTRWKKIEGKYVFSTKRFCKYKVRFFQKLLKRFHILGILKSCAFLGSHHLIKLNEAFYDIMRWVCVGSVIKHFRSLELLVIDSMILKHTFLKYFKNW